MMPSLDDGALSGAFVMRHCQIFREMFGAEAVAGIIAELSPEDAREVTEATPVGWVSVAAVTELFSAAARRAGRSEEALHAEVGARASAQAIRTVWRVVMRLTTDAQLISQIPVMYRKAWNRGTLTGKLAGPRQAIITLKSWPDTPEFALRGVRIGAEQVLLLAGRTSVSVKTTRTADGAEYSASW